MLMRKVMASCTAALLVGGLASCGDVDPLTPDAPGISTQTRVQSANEVQTSPNATMVPIHGEAAIAVDLTAGFIPCVLEGTDIVVAEFPARFRSEGQFSHLGRTTSVIDLLTCTAGTDGSVFGPGEAVHTAANGDQLHAEWTGRFQPDGSSELWIVFSGGTGRFAGATGGGAGGGSSDPATFAGSWWFDGMLSRVGAK
ncbi:MAG: hypothetical protein P8188_20630 [Gemmatimonadota bacterium]